MDQRNGSDKRALQRGDTDTGDSITLWRPAGPEEMDLVRKSGFRRWPPRLPEQPIFYPVLNEAYAGRIAKEWNVPASGIGFVTRFSVKKAFMDNYEIHRVGGKGILEYWIPAQDLEQLNDNISGRIEVVCHYDSDGNRISGDVIERFHRNPSPPTQ